MVCLRLCGQKMLRSDFFQISNTYSFHSNEQNICVKFSEKHELWEYFVLLVNKFELQFILIFF